MLEISLSNLDLLGLAECVLDRGNALRFRARGRSMHPFIKDGDILEIEHCCGETLRLTDVILYKAQDRRLFVHRVVSIDPDRRAIIAQGDALIRRDAPILPEQILGRVTAIQRGSRVIRLDSFLQRTLSRMWIEMHFLRPYLLKARALTRYFLRGILEPSIHPHSR